LVSVQTVEQHSEPLKQTEPDDLQGKHVPPPRLVQTSPGQQSELLVQPTSPDGMQDTHLALDPSQRRPEQHSELLRHGAPPFGKHVTHVPPVEKSQKPEQQAEMPQPRLPIARQQSPLEQTCRGDCVPSLQVVPHAPQFFVSELVSTQMLLQQVPEQQSPPPLQRFPFAVQHLPPTQAWVLLQAEPVLPHLHTPLEQVSPVGAQAWLQLPQLPLSVWVLTQVLPQFVCPLGQHLPFEQLPLSQVIPQPPQLAASLNVLVHAERPGLLEPGQQSG
jgi:hypothetical protein